MSDSGDKTEISITVEVPNLREARVGARKILMFPVLKVGRIFDKFFSEKQIIGVTGVLLFSSIAVASMSLSDEVIDGVDSIDPAGDSLLIEGDAEFDGDISDVGDVGADSIDGTDVEDLGSQDLEDVLEEDNSAGEQNIVMDSQSISQVFQIAGEGDDLRIGSDINLDDTYEITNVAGLDCEGDEFLDGNGNCVSEDELGGTGGIQETLQENDDAQGEDIQNLENVDAERFEIMIDDIDSVERLSDVNVPGMGMTRTSLSINDDYLFITDVDENNLVVMDVSDPDNPDPVFSADFGWDRGYQNEIRGDYMYVGDRSPDLQVVDISNPSDIEEVGSAFNEGTSRAYGIDISGSNVYAATRDGVEVFDITRPEDPNNIGKVESGSRLLDIRVKHGYAYLAERNSGLRVVDVSDPSDMEEVAYESFGDEPSQVRLVDNHAFIGDRDDSTFYAVDVTDPEDPQLVDSVSISGTTDYTSESLDVAGDYAYLATTAGMEIVDISDPDNMNHLGAEPDTFGGVKVLGTKVYSAGDNLGVYDLPSIDIASARIESLEADKARVKGELEAEKDARIDGDVSVGGNIEIDGSFDRVPDICVTDSASDGDFGGYDGLREFVENNGCAGYRACTASEVSIAAQYDEDKVNDKVGDAGGEAWYTAGIRARQASYSDCYGWEEGSDSSNADVWHDSGRPTNRDCGNSRPVLSCR